mgnify:CR=1 FL=1
MTLVELAEQIKEIESKYTKKSNFRMTISIGTDMIPKYSVEHSTPDYKTVNIGYGTTDIKELIIKFEMAMSAHYRFHNDKQVASDITL